MITDILKFDVVMNHILSIKRKGVSWSIHTDIKNWNDAQKMTMELAQKGLLDEIYKRIIEGTI